MLPLGNPAYPFGTGAYEDLGAAPAQSSFFGQQGWWTVPFSWYITTDSGGQIWASPNADFSAPKYAVKINQAFEMVYFDTMRNLQSGNLSGS